MKCSLLVAKFLKLYTHGFLYNSSRKSEQSLQSRGKMLCTNNHQKRTHKTQQDLILEARRKWGGEIEREREKKKKKEYTK